MSIPQYCFDALCRGFSYLFPPQKDIMQESAAFGASEWQKLGIDVKTPPIPQKIQEYLNTHCPFWPDKYVKETHFLCLIPDHITLKKLYELIRPTPHTHFLENSPDFAENPYWILITKATIPNSRHLNPGPQKELLASYGYEMPTMLEAATAVVTSKACDIIMYPKAGQFTRCKTDDNWPVAVGSDNVVPFSININDCNCINGVAGVYIVPPSPVESS